MKITKSIFGKEGNDIDKFNELDLDERSIVFYSESSVILYPYVEEVIRELQNRDQKICYLTSSKYDPIFKNKSKNIKVFYIGDSEIEKINFFLRLKAKVQDTSQLRWWLLGFGAQVEVIKPVALRCVYEISSKFDIPILGCGGISTWEDAVEFILAGASAVQFGSVMGDHWDEVFSEINNGIEKFMERKGYSTIGEMVGRAKRS